MENIKPEVHIDPEKEIERIRCCKCFTKNTKDNKRCICSKCCNRRIVLTKIIKKPLHSLKRFFTD